MKDIQGKVAVVTGGASGIGRAMAERFAEDGMRIVLADVEEGALAKAESEMRADGAEVLAVRADVSKEDEVRALAEKSVDAFGVVHILCNNAGVGVSGRSWEIGASDWKWVMGVNFWGVVHGIRHFTPIMLKSGDGGHIVNVASMAGLTTGTGMSPYFASKHAVVALSESLYFELQEASPDVHVSVLCPGWVDTQIHDSDRNRPGGRIDESTLDADAKLHRERIRTSLHNGLSPREVAEAVFQGIKENTFYILPDGDWASLVRPRLEGILEGRAPTLSLPPGVFSEG